MKASESTETWLKSNGLKSTKQRSTLIKILLETEIPLDADEILKQIRMVLQDCNLSTVYRNMDIMIERKLIVEMRLGTKSYYMLNKDQHGHYIQCVSCKQMVHVDECPFENFEEKLEQRLGFKLLSHRVELFGICKKCNGNDH
jgi:Fur family ferric uptake transcriptional regulator